MKKTIDEWNAQFKEWNGFAEDGSAYVIGGDTYAIKDELKANGAKWNNAIKAWQIPDGSSATVYAMRGYSLFKINIDDVYNKYNFKYEKFEINEAGVAEIQKKISKLRAHMNEVKYANLEFVGTVSESYETRATLIDWKTYCTQFGDSIKYKFNDDNGNIITWMTSKHIPFDRNDKVILQGKVKAHDNWNGIKTTVMTRCNVERG